MKTRIDTDTVLDLVRLHQESLANRIDMELSGSGARRALWDEYKKITELYNDVRRASNESGE